MTAPFALSLVALAARMYIFEIRFEEEKAR